MKKALLNNNRVVIKKEFEIIGIIFPKGAVGICTHEGKKGFLVLFETFKTDSINTEKSWVTFSNQYKQYFKVSETLNKPWYEFMDRSARDSNNEM